MFLGGAKVPVVRREGEVVGRARRRDSTILAGNLSYQESLLAASTVAEISVIRRPARREVQVLQEEEEEQEDFESCEGSSEPVEVERTWMTEVVEVERRQVEVEGRKVEDEEVEDLLLDSPVVAASTASQAATPAARGPGLSAGRSYGQTIELGGGECLGRTRWRGYRKLKLPASHHKPLVDFLTIHCSNNV